MSPRPTSLSPRENLKQARRDVHRQHLLEAAERVFAERGYDGARMQDVAEQTGLSLATVYALISGKEELYAEIHRARGRALLLRAQQATVGCESALQSLLQGVGVYIEFLTEHPDYLRILLRESQPWALEPRYISAEQERQWREGLELTAAVFRAAIAEGSIVDEDPVLLARLMIAAHQVYLVQWIEAGMTEPAAALVARTQGHVRRAFGVAAPLSSSTR